MNRDEILSKASEKLKLDFDDIVQKYPHALTKGEEVEKILIEFLKTHLPKRFDIASGFILDKNGQISTQQDIIVYDALNALLYSVDSNNCIIPNDNVALSVEVKSRLTSKEVKETANKVEIIKGLYKTLDNVNVSRPNNRLISYTTLSFIFAFSSTMSMEKIASVLKEECVERVSEGKHIDGIFVLDKGFVILAVELPNKEFGPAFMERHPISIPGSKVYVYPQDHGRQTLDYFLRLILSKLAIFYHRIDHPGFEWEMSQDRDKYLLYEVPQEKIGRNEECFCRSEKKYKKCCGR